MFDPYVLDYFLFTFLTSFGVLQIALSKKLSKRTFFGWGIILLSYFWFFASRNRGVQTILEGVQLSFIFTVSASLAIIATKCLNLFIKRR